MWECVQHEAVYMHVSQLVKPPICPGLVPGLFLHVTFLSSNYLPLIYLSPSSELPDNRLNNALPVICPKDACAPLGVLCRKPQRDAENPDACKSV